jgi:hypothetical protein
MIAAPAVAFVFFPQVSLRVALCYSELVASHLAVPWSGRLSVLWDWGGPSTYCSACYMRRKDKYLLSGGPGQDTAGRLAIASLRRRAIASL